MTRQTRVDWAKAERFYRAGVITTRMIAQKCDCTRQAVEKRAKEKGWTRNLQSCTPEVAPDKQLKSCAPADATNRP